MPRLGHDGERRQGPRRAVGLGGELAAKTKVQKGVKIEHAVVPDANHFFEDKIEDLIKVVGAYVDRRMLELEKERRE